MASGLSSVSHGHSHFFRDLAKLAQKNTSARAQDPTETETTTASTDITAEADSSSEGTDEMISKLEARNTEVLSHEATHMAAAGAYIKGGASYTYQIGPDGKAYAIGGEVSIDMSPVPGNPRATIAKMMAIRAAAMSPFDPSSQDAAVAAAAAQIEAQARAQLNQSLSENANSTALQTAASRYNQPTDKAGWLVNAFA